MSLGYTLAYATGITPWERAAEVDAPGLDRLYAREEADHEGPGRMIDLGCGSGAHRRTGGPGMAGDRRRPGWRSPPPRSAASPEPTSHR